MAELTPRELVYRTLRFERTPRVLRQLWAGLLAATSAFMHSDGYIVDIYDDLIEVGVDAINSQLFCMNIEEIGRRCKGRVTFWGEIDRQHILALGTEEETRAAVRRVAGAFYNGHGGVIA